jgi:hypothetical protein
VRSRKFAKPPVRNLPQLRETLGSDKGIGEPIVTKFLDGVPSISESTVKHQLANLKSSGEYANIIKAVQEEIEQENREALLA